MHRATQSLVMPYC